MPEAARQRLKLFHAVWATGFVPERHPEAENSPPAKHVVATGLIVRDGGSTPPASTSLRSERGVGRRDKTKSCRSTLKEAK